MTATAVISEPQGTPTHGVAYVTLTDDPPPGGMLGVMI